MKKKKLGQFFTDGNPFDFPQFRSWIKKALVCSSTILEPFAGSNKLIDKLLKLGYKFNFQSYDIEPKNIDVFQRDTILDFPTGFKVIVTNPPWLAKNSAKRKGIKIENDWGKHDNLYKLCLEKMLKNSEYVATILPASFVKKVDAFSTRIESVTFLNYKIFNETENPSCLALFVPENEKKSKNIKIFSNYNSNKYIEWNKTKESLNNILKPKKKIKIEFNKKKGNLGVITIDKSNEENIRFTKPEEIPENKIKNTSRHIVRIFVDDKSFNHDKMLKVLNSKLNQIRDLTDDIFMTPFKGLIRSKGRYRRRIDFSLLRRIILSTF